MEFFVAQVFWTKDIIVIIPFDTRILHLTEYHRCLQITTVNQHTFFKVFMIGSFKHIFSLKKVCLFAGNCLSDWKVTKTRLTMRMTFLSSKLASMNAYFTKISDAILTKLLSISALMILIFLVSKQNQLKIEKHNLIIFPHLFFDISGFEIVEKVLK